MTMFGLPKNPSIELWDGPRTGLDGIIEKFGADQAYTSMQFASRLKEAINNAKCIYVDTNMSSGSILSASEPAQKLISNGTTPDWSKWQEGGVAGLLTDIVQSFESYGKGFRINLGWLIATNSKHEIKAIKGQANVPSSTLLMF